MFSPRERGWRKSSYRRWLWLGSFQKKQKHTELANEALLLGIESSPEGLLSPLIPPPNACLPACQRPPRHVVSETYFPAPSFHTGFNLISSLGTRRAKVLIPRRCSWLADTLGSHWLFTITSCREPWLRIHGSSLLKILGPSTTSENNAYFIWNNRLQLSALYLPQVQETAYIIKQSLLGVFPKLFV